MSLSVAGVWAVGVWDQTVWAADVWREGDYTPNVTADSPANFQLGVPEEFNTPSLPYKFGDRPFDPKVDVNFEVLARLAEANAYLEEVDQWVDRELGVEEVYENPFELGGLEPDPELTGSVRWRRTKR